MSRDLDPAPIEAVSKTLRQERLQHFDIAFVVPELW
jgi:hypothetical protein